MNKKIALFIAGIACFSAAILWRVFVAPEILALPSDFSFSAEIVSVDDFFDEERGVYSGGLYSKTDYKYETISSTDGVSVIKNNFAVRTPDNKPLFAVERLYGIDQKTGMHIAGAGDTDRTGYLFAPKHLKTGESFEYWHVNYDSAATMQFVGTDDLHGLHTYRYETSYEGANIDQTENLSHLPEIGETRGIRLEPYLEIWIEPISGRLIKYHDDTIGYYYNLKTGEKQNPWNHFSNTLHDRSVQENARIAQIEKTKAQTFELYIPILLAILGVALLLRAVSAQTTFLKILTPGNIARLVGLLTISVAIMSLIGWIFDIPALTQVIPRHSAMNPTTAICFLLIGSASLLQQSFASRASIALGLVAATVGAVRIIDIAGLLPFSVDLQIYSTAVLASAVPARMAQYTAASFLLLGLVPFVAKWQWSKKIHLAEILSSAVFVFSLLALVGYSFGSLELLTIPTFFSAAFHTVILFFFSSVAMYISNRVSDEFSLALKGWLSVSGVLVASALITIVFASALDAVSTREAEALFTNEVDRTASAIEERVSIYVSALEGAKGLLVASESVERSEWKAYVDTLDIQERYIGIQGIGYAIFVQPDDKEEHIAAIQEEGFPDYSIRPEGERDLYSTIIYLEPFDLRNKQAFGFDMFSNEIRRTAMEQARDTGQARMSGRITLVQEIDDDIQPGFLIYVPFYGVSGSHQTLEERREHIVGYTYSPFRARNFITGIIGENGIPDIGLRINDGANASSESILYEDVDNVVDPEEVPRFMDSRTIYVAGRPWSLTFVSSSHFGETQLSKFGVPIILLAGVVMSSLLSLIFYTLASSRSRAVSYADQATRSLREAKAKDEAMLSSIADGFVATDHQGRIILVNKAFETISGWGEKDVLGNKLTEILPMLDEDEKKLSEAERPITKALKKSETSTVTDMMYKRKDGTNFPVAATVSPILIDNELIGAVEIFRDITKEREIDRAKTEFVSLASHQLRTPLSTVNWYAEMLISGDAGKLNAEQRKYLDEIYLGNQRMVELVNALLSVSRLELGTFKAEPKTVDIVKLATAALDEQKTQIATKKIAVQTDFVKKMPTILADPKLLGMVFQNLLSNAIKYTPKKGSITLKISLEKENIAIQISDTGWGIPKSQQGRIFEKLFRADNVKQNDTQGTGLGLYIVQSIINQSGGKIWFESAENKGTTFYLTLPISGMPKKDSAKTLT